MFSYSPIDRRGQIRTDVEAVQGLLQSQVSRTMLWHDGHFVMDEDKPRYFMFDEIRALNCVLERSVYLGRYQGIEFFACRVLSPGDSFDDSQCLALRQASRQVNEEHLGLMFYAQGLLNWHQNHGFCSRCGGDMKIIEAGHARQCANPNCTKVLYPKIDPAVIFSIVNNTGAESKILLGRQKKWDENRYSVIAGFVEPGETLEDAVRREAWEETGLEVIQVEYFASQSWPFPDSLMLGFSCQTAQHSIRLIDHELETADWFTADQVESRISAGELKMPFNVSISWHLIDRWFKVQTGYSLASVENGSLT